VNLVFDWHKFGRTKKREKLKKWKEKNIEITFNTGSVRSFTSTA
jgi:hypothetical protein